MGSNRVNANQAVAANLKVDASGVAVPVTDNGGSLTVDGTVAVTGVATETTLAAGNVLEGAVTETAPATDTASSGLNGRLQRIAQRLTSLIAVFTIGAGTEAAAVRVTLPTDGTGKVAAAQSGTWTVQPGNTANTTAWKVDGSAVTQPVSGTVTVGTLPGTGIEDAAETAGGTLVMTGTVRRDTPASSAGTTGDNATLNTDSLGHVWVALPAIVAVSQTPTVSTSPAYTAKDAVGGLLTFANAVRLSGGSGILQSVTINDNSQQRPSLELVLFNQTFTASSDNAIFAPSDADLANSIGVVAVNSWSDFSTNSIATVDGIGKAFVLTGTSLFGQLVTRGTPTFVATSDIVVVVKVIQN